MSKIFITGATGFLGSAIANHLIAQGHHVIASYRESSSKVLCAANADHIEWILQDVKGLWINKIIKTKPDVVVHSAWLGVGHTDRYDWDVQIKNIEFLKQILKITQQSGTTKFIALGSQAEYGLYNDYIDEYQQLKPTEAYGQVKIIASSFIEQFCNHYKIDWYWLRLFSFFGEGESERWLIPSLIKRIIFNDYMDLTLGEQQYSFLYVNDLGVAIHNIIKSNNKSGIYNLSGSTSTTLKSLIESIKNKVNPNFKLNFGALPYRENQCMKMLGNSSKFIDTFGKFEESDFDKSLSKTINYYIKKYTAINEGI